MMRALVTGGAGFVGQWLARTLLQRGIEVFAGHLGEPGPESPVLTPDEARAVRWVSLDVRDDQQVTAAIDASRPDFVLHVAAISHVPDAYGTPAIAYDVNAIGAGRIVADLVSRRRAGVLDPAVLVIGSAEQYGRHEPAAMPLTEDAPCRPLTVYATSKAAQELIALQAFRADGLRVVCTRSFNHSGVGHAGQFLLPSLVRRGLAIRAGHESQLAIGNANVVRDFLHVEDVVRAYLLLLERGHPGEVYNVCSGTGVSVGDLARAVLQRLGATGEITTDPALVRPVDVPVLVGSPRKLSDATGWTPQRTRDDIIDDLIHAATR